VRTENIFLATKPIFIKREASRTGKSSYHGRKGACGNMEMKLRARENVGSKENKRGGFGLGNLV